MSLNFLKCSVLLIIVGTLFSSCEKEPLDVIGSESDSFVSNSLSAFDSPQQNAAAVAEGECFAIAYPIEVTDENGAQITIADDAGLETFLDDWDDTQELNDTDVDPVFTYPIVATLDDGSVETIDNLLAFYDLLDSCDDFDEHCDDFDELEECFDFVYPVTLIFPDSTMADLMSSDDLLLTLETWFEENPESEDDYSFVFPLMIEFEDGTLEDILTEDDLEAAAELCDDDDDDGDDDDDDDHDADDDDDDDDDDDNG